MSASQSSSESNKTEENRPENKSFSPSSETPSPASQHPENQSKITFLGVILGAIITGIFAIIVAFIGYEGKVEKERINIQDTFDKTVTVIAENSLALKQSSTPMPTYTFLPTLTPWPTYTPFPGLLQPVGDPVDPDVWQIEILNFLDKSAIPLTKNVSTETIEDKTINLISPSSEVILKAEQLHEPKEKEGWSQTNQSVQFLWQNPILRKPLGGMVAEIFVEPSSRDREDRIFCEFLITYDLDGNNHPYPYTSSDRYISLNQWNTLAWDFQGIYSDISPWKDTISTTVPKGHGFLYLSSGLGERMLYDAAVSKNPAWNERIKSVGIQCFVSASRDYVGEASKVDFTGTIKLGRVWVFPVDYP